MLTRVLLLLLLGSTAVSYGGQIREVTFEISKIQNKRDPYLPNYTLLEGSSVVIPERGIDSRGEYWTHRVGLGLDYDIYKVPNFRLYLDQEVVGYSTNDQYRRLYWDWEVGTNIADKVDVFVRHRSEHSLETRGTSDYPLEDLIGIRFYLYKK